MGPSGGTGCFETSGNKWDRKYQDWYCGNSPQCRDILLSTLTPNYLLFWWPDFLQSQPPHTFLLPEKFPKLPVSKFPELVWPVTGLITGGVYLLLQKLSFISLGLKFPNNPVILGPGYSFFFISLYMGSTPWCIPLTSMQKKSLSHFYYEWLY